MSWIDVPINEELDPPAWADDAIEVVKHEWADRFHSYILLDEDIEVRWFEGECIRYDFDDDYFNSYPGDCLLGHYVYDSFGNEKIFIALPSWAKNAHEISLAHEMLHWHMDKISHDSDGAHRGAHWDNVREVEIVLADAGM